MKQLLLPVATDLRDRYLAGAWKYIYRNLSNVCAALCLKILQWDEEKEAEAKLEFSTTSEMFLNTKPSWNTSVYT